MLCASKNAEELAMEARKRTAQTKLGSRKLRQQILLVSRAIFICIHLDGTELVHCLDILGVGSMGGD